MSDRDKQIFELKKLFQKEAKMTRDAIKESSEKSTRANEKIANGTAHHIFLAIKQKVLQ